MEIVVFLLDWEVNVVSHEVNNRIPWLIKKDGLCMVDRVRYR